MPVPAEDEEGAGLLGDSNYRMPVAVQAEDFSHCQALPVALLNCPLS